MPAIAEWFFDGDGVDAVGNSHLTLSNAGGQLSFVADAAGGGVQSASFNNNDRLEINGLDAVTLGAALDGLKQFTVVLRTDTFTAQYPLGIAFIISAAGPDDIYLYVGDTGIWTFCWGDNHTATFYGADEIAVVIDTTQANAADRARLYKDGVQAAWGGSTPPAIPQDYTLSGFNNAGAAMSVMNNIGATDSPDAGSIIKYLGLFNEAIDAASASNIHTNLDSDDDSSPFIAPVLSFTSGPSISNLSYQGFDLTYTTNLDCEADILITAPGTNQPDESSFDAATQGGTLVGGQENSTTLGEPLIVDGQDYRIWFRASNGTTVLYPYVDVSVPVFVQEIAEVAGGFEVQEGSAGVVVSYNDGAEASFDFVWPDSLYDTDVTLSVDTGTGTISINGVAQANVGLSGDESDDTYTVQVMPAANAGFILIAEGYDAAESDISAVPDLIPGDNVGYLLLTSTGIPVSIDALGNVSLDLSGAGEGANLGTITAWGVDQIDGVRSADVVFPAELAEAPTVDTQPQNTTVNTGQQFTFTVAVSGPAPLSYEWQRNGSPIAGATNTSYIGVGGTDGDTGDIFTCVVTGGEGASVVSDGAQLTVTAAGTVAPTVDTQPQNTTVNTGQQFTFTVAVSGGVAPLVVQWQRNGSPIAGATGTSYTGTAGSTGADGDEFRAVVTGSDGGQVTTSPATLEISSVSVTPGVTFGSHTGIAELDDNGNPVLLANESGVTLWLVRDGNLVQYVSGLTLNSNGLPPNIALPGEPVGTSLICFIRFSNGSGVPPFNVTIEDIG